MLEDVNDEIPLFTEREQETVLEGEPIGTKVTQVNAIDKDGTFPNNRVSSLSLLFRPCTAVILLRGFTLSLSNTRRKCNKTRRFLYSQRTNQIDRYTSEVNSRSIFSIYTVFEDLAIKKKKKKTIFCCLPLDKYARQYHISRNLLASTASNCTTRR